VACGQEIVPETPKAQTPSIAAHVESAITAGDRAHWRFGRSSGHRCRRSTKRLGCATAIDAFILAKLEPADSAGCRGKVDRRCCAGFRSTLIGLPPTPEELAAFEGGQLARRL